MTGFSKTPSNCTGPKTIEATCTVRNVLNGWSREERNEQQNNVPGPKKTMQVVRVSVKIELLKGGSLLKTSTNCTQCQNTPLPAIQGSAFKPGYSGHCRRHLNNGLFRLVLMISRFDPSYDLG